MTVKLVMLPPQSDQTRRWARRLADEVAGVRVSCPEDAEEATAELADADAAYGTLPPDLLRHAGRLRWLQAPQAGLPPGYFHAELQAHPVVVTNLRATYTEHVATHALAMVLALVRGLPRYAARQARREWDADWNPGSVLHLPEAAALVVGVGAVGGEVGRLCAAFGMRVVGTDARRTEPTPGMSEVHPAEALDGLLPRADVVILTVPHTPETERLMQARRFAAMRPSAYLVNVGRGPTVDLDDLVSALAQGTIRGAALDVFPEEPLPPEHPLWGFENVLITPHVAGVGPYADERRYGVLLENARRFAAGEPLVNVVDKASWF
jgi:phosphoglycerate dehydrogenase-like enzyme